MVNERQESPLFEVSNSGAIASGESYNVVLDETTQYGKYTPFNFFQVQNNSSQKTRVIVNDSVRKIVPAGTIQTFDASTVPAVWSIRVVNLGGADINADEIQVAFQKIKGVKARAVKLLTGDI